MIVINFPLIDDGFSINIIKFTSRDEVQVTLLSNDLIKAERKFTKSEFESHDLEINFINKG